MLREFFLDESAQATSEYVLLLALVVLPIAIAFNRLKAVLRDLLDSLNNLVAGPGL